MHLDVYQGKNKNNIDIHVHAQVLPTTQKAVANALLKSGEWITPYHDGQSVLYSPASGFNVY